MNEPDQVAWFGLREIYRLIGTPEGNTILRLLLRKESMRTSELMEESKIPLPKFHVVMKALVLCQILEKKVHQDRSVWYSISPFGKNVLRLSEPLVEKIQEKMKDKNSALLSVVQNKMS
jgi:DNA-binding IclR family transcriptional regulator